MLCAEYIWIDGYKPTAKLRSKTKIVEDKIEEVSDLPEWGFDGSSTLQAEGHFSDCLLKPVSIFRDPIRGGDNINNVVKEWVNKNVDYINFDELNKRFDCVSGLTK